MNDADKNAVIIGLLAGCFVAGAVIGIQQVIIDDLKKDLATQKRRTSLWKRTTMTLIGDHDTRISLKAAKKIMDDLKFDQIINNF